MKDPATIALSYTKILQIEGRVSHNAKCVVWDGGATEVDYPGWLTAAAECEVISDDADDNVAGGGATHITVVGQGDDGLEISEEKSLNGLGAVDLVNEYKIIYRAFVSQTEDTSPLTGPNHGTITVRRKAGPINMSKIIPTMGNALAAIYRVPSNMYAELINVYLAASAKVAAQIAMRTSIASPWIVKSVLQTDYSYTAILGSDVTPIFLAPGTDMCIVATPGAAADISAHLGLKLYDL